MNDGLRQESRRAIIRILAGNPRVERAVLFGSRAMGRFRPESDIDLALFGEALSLGDLLRLSVAIDGLPIPQRVDLLRVHGIVNRELLRHIETDGLPWFVRDQRPGSFLEVPPFRDGADPGTSPAVPRLSEPAE